MLILLTTLAYVLLGILVESLFTAYRTEIVFFTLIFRSSGGILFIYLHFADRVNCHDNTSLCCYVNFTGLKLLSRKELDTTVIELAAIAAAARMGLRKP